jgi:streptogramin lyase
MPNSNPYDAVGDPSGNIWVSDGGQGGTMIKFDPRAEKFTYYPTPQLTDMPKVRITKEGAIWFAPRSSSRAAASVLYPDVTKMKTLAAVEY